MALYEFPAGTNFDPEVISYGAGSNAEVGMR